MKRFETARVAVVHYEYSNEVISNNEGPIDPFYFVSRNLPQNKIIQEKFDALKKLSRENFHTVSVNQIFDILGDQGWEMIGHNPNVVKYSFSDKAFRVDYYFKREIS